MHVERRTFAFRYPSPEAYVDYWRRFYGPTMKAFEAVGPSGSAALEADLLELIERFNRADDGTMIVPSGYLEVVIIKRDTDRLMVALVAACSCSSPVVGSGPLRGRIDPLGRGQPPGIVRPATSGSSGRLELTRLPDPIAVSDPRATARGSVLVQAQSEARRDPGGFGPRRGADLAQDVRDMHAGRVLADEQLLGDLPVRRGP